MLTARSWLWLLLALLVKATGKTNFIAWFAELESVYFDACAHGSSRGKRTKLLATPGLFSSLGANCTQDHKHASWQPYKNEHGVLFPTAAEAEYPSLLCNRMAQCVLQMAASMGVAPQVPQRMKDLLRMGIGHQSVKHHPLIPEYKAYVHAEQPVSNPSHKLLAAPPQTGAEGQNKLSSQSQKRGIQASYRTTFKYGVWHNPEEFLQRACEVRLRKLSFELKQQEIDLKMTMRPDASVC